MADTKLTGTDVERRLAADVAATPPGMAYVIGSGPEGKTCHQCLNWQHKDKDYFAANGRYEAEIKPAPCAKFRQLCNGVQGPPVEHWNAACKYFDENPEPPPLRKKSILRLK
jgi:hypothetical protein